MLANRPRHDVSISFHVSVPKKDEQKKETFFSI